MSSSTLTASRSGHVGHLPRLVGWTSTARGQVALLDAALFTIGSGRKANLRIEHAFVSRRQAEVCLQKDGHYTLVDPGSRNGTRVNGQRVATGQAITLQHGDCIFFAHCGFFFDTGRGVPGNRRLARWGGAVAALLLALLAAGRVWLSDSPADTARRVLNMARLERFDEALAQLDTCRADAVELADLRHRIQAWRDVHGKWHAFASALNDRRWRTAVSVLPAPDLQTSEMWNWSGDGSRRLASLHAAAWILTNHLAAVPTHPGSGTALARLRQSRQEIDPVMAQDLPGFLQAVADFEKQLSVADRFPFLDGLQEWPLPLAAAGQACAQALRSAGTPSERQALESVGKDLECLRAAVETYGTLCRAVRDLAAPEGSTGVHAGLCPAADAARLDGRIGTAWDALASRAACATNLAGRIEALRHACGGDPNTPPRSVRDLRDEPVLAKILSCDTRTLAPDGVDRDRAGPVGEYDRFLGVEHFRSLCLRLAGQKDSGIRPLVTPFTTGLEQASAYFAAADGFCRALDAAGGLAPDLAGSACASLAGVCRANLALRDQAAEACMQAAGRAAEAADNRRAVIAAALAIELRPDLDRHALAHVTAQQFVANLLAVNRDLIPAK